MISEESTQDGEISQRRRENFYTTLQYKIGQMIAQSQIYLNHAPNHEKHALCQEIRVAQIELANLVTACRKYPRLDVVRELDVKHEQLLEAPLSKDRGFTLTVRQLFRGAKPPERHRLYKVCAADLFPVPPCSRNSASRHSQFA